MKIGDRLSVKVGDNRSAKCPVCGKDMYFIWGRCGYGPAEYLGASCCDKTYWISPSVITYECSYITDDKKVELEEDGECK